MENIYSVYVENEEATEASSGRAVGFPEIIFHNISAISFLRPNAQGKSFTSSILAASF